MVRRRSRRLVPYAPALFDRSRYAYEIGQGHLQRFFETGEDDSLIAALDAHRRALAAAPADAFAWSGLAWAEAAQGATGAARTALETSWRLAPYNIALALDRASLVQSGALGADLASGAGHRRDLAVLAQRGFAPAPAAPADDGVIPGGESSGPRS